MWASVRGETAWSRPACGRHGRCDRHDGVSGSGRRRQVGGDLEETRRPSAEAPRPEPAPLVPGPDPLLYDGQVQVWSVLKGFLTAESAEPNSSKKMLIPQFSNRRAETEFTLLSDLKSELKIREFFNGVWFRGLGYLVQHYNPNDFCSQDSCKLRCLSIELNKLHLKICQVKYLFPISNGARLRDFLPGFIPGQQKNCAVRSWLVEPNSTEQISV